MNTRQLLDYMKEGWDLKHDEDIDEDYWLEKEYAHGKRKKTKEIPVPKKAVVSLLRKKLVRKEKDPNHLGEVRYVLMMDGGKNV